MIRRASPQDAKAIVPFLKRVFTDDLETGGHPEQQSKDWWSQATEGENVWLAVEKGKVVGVLGPGLKMTHDSVEHGVRICTLFTLLVVDDSLYKAQRSEAIRVARELTLGAADDLRDSGRMTEYIFVYGPTNSRGASWARLLGMKEKVGTTHSEFWLPFKDIWENARATEKREGLP